MPRYARLFIAVAAILAGIPGVEVRLHAEPYLRKGQHVTMIAPVSVFADGSFMRSTSGMVRPSELVAIYTATVTSKGGSVALNGALDWPERGFPAMAQSNIHRLSIRTVKGQRLLSDLELETERGPYRLFTFTFDPPVPLDPASLPFIIRAWYTRRSPLDLWQPWDSGFLNVIAGFDRGFAVNRDERGRLVLALEAPLVLRIDTLQIRLPADLLKRFNAHEISEQRLIDGSVILVNSHPVGVKLPD